MVMYRALVPCPGPCIRLRLHKLVREAIDQAVRLNLAVRLDLAVRLILDPKLVLKLVV